MFTVDEMIKELKWRPLEDRRRDARQALFYKIENNLVATEKGPALFHQQEESGTAMKRAIKYQ